MLYFASGPYHLARLTPALPDDPPLDPVGPNKAAHPYGQGGIRWRPRLSLQGEPGTRLLWQNANNASIIGSEPPYVGNIRILDDPHDEWEQVVITADVAVGDTTFVVESDPDPSSILEAGDTVLIRLDIIAHNDPNGEVKWWAFAEVTDVHDSTGELDPATVTLDRAAQIPMVVADQFYLEDPEDPESDVEEFRTKIIRKVTDIVENVSIRQFEFGLGPAADAEYGGVSSGIWLHHARNVTIEDITATDTCAGVLTVVYGENISARRLHVRQSRIFGAQIGDPIDPEHPEGPFWQTYQFPSQGRGLTLGGLYGATIDDVVLEKFQGVAIFAEVGTRQVRMRNVRMVNNSERRHNDDALTGPLIFTVNDTDLHIDGLTIEGNAGCRLHTQGGDFHTRRNTLSVTDLQLRTVPPDVDFIEVDVRSLDGRVRRHRPRDDNMDLGVFRFAPTRTWSRAIGIPPGANTTDIRLPDGLLRRGRCWVTDATDLTHLYVINQVSETPNGDQITDLIGDVNDPNEGAFEFPYRLTAMGTDESTGPEALAEQFVDESGEPFPRLLRLVTDSDQGAGAYVVIQIEYFPIEDQGLDASRDDHEDAWVQDTGLIGRARAVQSTADITLDATSWDDVAELEVSIAADPGQILLYFPNFRVGPGDEAVNFDVECDASAIRWSTGTTGGATQGVHGWRVNAQVTSHEVTGGVTRQVTAADATDGIVTLKLVYQLDDTDSRDLRGTTNARARVEVINLGWPRA